MRKFTIILACFLLFGFQAAQAQRTITGVVTSSEDSKPIPGVTIVIQGTSVGTATDLDGTYTIKVPEGGSQVLVFTFVGMKSRAIALGSSNVLNIIMEPEALEIEGVVVTALGITREKKALGYAV